MYGPLPAWMRQLLALCVMALGATVPRVAQAQDDFQRQLLAAERLYESREQEVAVALREGIFLAGMGQWKKAQTAFRQGLLLEPEATLPLRVSPKLERDFEEVRTRVRKELGLSERPAPSRVKPQESRPAPVAQTDRPEQPRLKAPEGQAAPAYVPSAATEKPARVSRVPPIVLEGAKVAASVAAVVFQGSTCPDWGDASPAERASMRGPQSCHTGSMTEPGFSMAESAARRR
ncbi:hypothetical protein POL68_25530 [Stigmatella sp. ncwal1]|uniref:Tetratricopeptide repeat protein n=1 Tax=Stigmatella ashevillensis TaxID=2995309 RepID=A0ABT5DDU6_9BACT|nr:hypothetical protein [Stigmatella ashevillena]MDC0711855.1 hypothetical protein [Stigmatella ashevillena]